MDMIRALDKLLVMLGGRSELPKPGMKACYRCYDRIPTAYTAMNRTTTWMLLILGACTALTVGTLVIGILAVGG